jgi:hypothetical protein
MTSWTKVQDELDSMLGDLQSPDPFYRGHANASWRLIPRLGRTPRQKWGSTIGNLESRLYGKFLVRGAADVPAGADSWDILILMQHYGVPTRLLDWTQSFGVALYFAMHDAAAAADCAVWVLDPHALNKSGGKVSLLRLDRDFPDGYEPLKQATKSGDSPPAYAVYAPRFDRRMQSQQAMFTLHLEMGSALEDVAPKCVRKLTIPPSAHGEARRFLRDAGIDYHVLFPDLQGLARQLLIEEFEKPV